MKVVVTSRNPVKKKAVLEGFKAYFSDAEIESIDVDSGVSDQPGTDDETLTGARNRVKEGRSQIYDADFWVAIEGGVQAGDKDVLAFAWVVIYSAGKYGEARTASFVLPKKVAHLVAGGMELGTPMILFSMNPTRNRKTGLWAF